MILINYKVKIYNEKIYNEKINFLNINDNYNYYIS